MFLSTFNGEASWVDVHEIENPGEVRYRLEVRTQGQGTVTRDPQQDSYKKNQKVTLTATPADGWVFDGWSGDANGKQNPLTFSVDKKHNFQEDAYLSKRLCDACLLQ